MKNYKLEKEIKTRADWEKSIEDAVVLSKKKKKKSDKIPHILWIASLHTCVQNSLS
jgi:hypothetical protein